MNVLNRVVEATADICGVEVTPNMEGRRMVMIIAPKPGVVRKAAEARKHAIAAHQAALAAAKHGGREPPKPLPQEEEMSEEDINADVEDDDDDEGDAPAEAPEN
jgi:hypothetical protein